MLVYWALPFEQEVWQGTLARTSMEYICLPQICLLVVLHT